LRVLENGFKIEMIETEYEPVGVDVEADLEQVREIMKQDMKEDTLAIVKGKR